MSKSAAYKSGIWAERIAAFYLMFKGYRILHMRYKTPVGEIDLLARKGRCLVAVEVKARRVMNDALESVRPKARRRIEKATLHFIALNEGYDDWGIRFDVIALCMRWPFAIKHLDNAWRSGQ